MKRILQVVLFFLTLFLIAEGLWGSNFAPKNLTTLFVWVHYRGLLVLTLILAGNYFCMSCPFIFARNGFRLFITPKKVFPKILSNKWTALALFISFLFCYEYFELWAYPRLTALLIIAYFLVALFIDLLFKNASFCKYLCPIGQFNFIASTLSPREVSFIDEKICQNCTTHECIKGGDHKRGCETNLFIPKKIGNLDCTFCLDCKDACPHQNVKISNVTYGQELSMTTHRSGLGKLSNRTDWLSFIGVFTIGGLLNAFMMIDRERMLRDFLKSVLFIQNDFFITVFIFLLALAPLFFLIKNSHQETRELIPSLIPLGFSIWFSHYSFHLLTGLFTFIPLIIKDSNWPIHLLGIPLRVVTPIQFGFLFLGLVASVITSTKITSRRSLLIKWNLFLAFLFLLAVWITSRPMEMRGTFLGAGP